MVRASWTRTRRVVSSILTWGVFRSFLLSGFSFFQIGCGCFELCSIGSRKGWIHHVWACNWKSVFTDVVSSYANLSSQKKVFRSEESPTSTDWFGTPTWPPFHCFGTPIWRTWRRAKTFYRAFSLTWPAVMQIYWMSDSFYMRKMFNCRRTGLRHQHGPRFIVLGHQYGGRDVMWKPQYPNTNSADWSPCISVKNWFREFVCWSKLFPSVIILWILTRFSLDDVLIMLREDWLWFLLGT